MPSQSNARVFGVKARLAQDLAGFAGSSKEFRALLSDREKTGDYHRVYTADDIRHIRRKLLGIAADTARAAPALLVFHMTKGGVGKTTLAANVAVALALHGYRVCLIDGDPQGTCSEMVGLDTADEALIHIGHLLQAFHEGRRQQARPERAVREIYPGHMLDVIPADITLAQANLWMVQASYREALFRRYLDAHQEFFAQYDAVVIDTAPSTSVLASALINAAMHTVIAPLTLDGQSIKAAHVLASVLSELNAGRDATQRLAPLIVPNAYRSGQSLSQVALSRLVAEFRAHMASTVIPHSPAFPRQFSVESGDDTNLPALEREPGSTAARAVLELARDLVRVFDIRLAGHADPRFLPSRVAA